MSKEKEKRITKISDRKFGKWRFIADNDTLEEQLDDSQGYATHAMHGMHGMPMHVPSEDDLAYPQVSEVSQVGEVNQINEVSKPSYQSSKISQSSQISKKILQMQDAKKSNKNQHEIVPMGDFEDLYFTDSNILQKKTLKEEAKINMNKKNSLVLRLNKPLGSVADVPLDNHIEDVELVRRSLVIDRLDERMLIKAVSIDVREPRNNSIQSIPCDGEPLNYYPYDNTQDAYLICCRSFIDLGAVSVVYQMKIENIDAGVILSLPEELILKYLTPMQKKVLKLFQEKNPEPHCVIKFIQSVCC